MAGNRIKGASELTGLLIKNVLVFRQEKKSGCNNEVTVRQGFVVILIKTDNFEPTVF